MILTLLLTKVKVILSKSQRIILLFSGKYLSYCSYCRWNPANLTHHLMLRWYQDCLNKFTICLLLSLGDIWGYHLCDNSNFYKLQYNVKAINSVSLMLMKTSSTKFFYILRHLQWCHVLQTHVFASASFCSTLSIRLQHFFLMA